MADLNKEIARGKHAQDLMEDSLLRECFDAVEGAYTAAWRASPAGAAADRERCWMAIRLVEQIRGHLVQVLTDGQVAAEVLEQEKIDV